jgi:hypothetical protein
MLVDVGLFQELASGLSNRRDIKRALAREVMVQQALGDAGPRRDLVDRKLVVGLISEELEAQVQQLLPANVDL